MKWHKLIAQAKILHQHMFLLSEEIAVERHQHVIQFARTQKVKCLQLLITKSKSKFLLFTLRDTEMDQGYQRSRVRVFEHF